MSSSLVQAVWNYGLCMIAGSSNDRVALYRRACAPACAEWPLTGCPHGRRLISLWFMERDKETEDGSESPDCEAVSAKVLQLIGEQPTEPGAVPAAVAAGGRGVLPVRKFLPLIHQMSSRLGSVA
jgi:hypothetical protein